MTNQDRITFKQFQQSRRYYENVSAIVDTGDCEAFPGFVYLGSYYIERLPQIRGYRLIVERSEYESYHLVDLERRLWNDFVKVDVNGPDEES